MASSPFGEAGRAHYDNIILPNETIPERLILSYTGNTPIDDVIHSTVNQAHDLTINRVGSVTGDGRPTDDLIIGYNGNEKLFGGGGDDHIYDGAGTDFLEGGAGHDTYYLSDDGQADVIIVSGDDRVIGGDSNDRIVIRADAIRIPSGADGLGDRADNLGIPLLGGFRQSPSEWARYVPALQSQHEEAVEGFLEATVALTSVTDAPSPWEEISTYDHFEGTMEEPTGSFLVRGDQTSNLFGASYLVDGDVLYIAYSYLNSENIADIGHVIVEDYEEGDFGIEFFSFSSAPIRSKAWDTITVQGEIIYAGNAAGIDHIHNGGNYITIPESIIFRLLL